jgi:protein TonB
MTRRDRLPTPEQKSSYVIRMQISIVIVLALMLGIAKMELKSENNETADARKQEVVKMEEVVQTEHEKLPPPPPRPQAPIEVPNDEIIDDVALNFDAEINMDRKLTLPPRPKDSNNDQEDQVFVIVETPPKLIGGLQELQKKISYPEMARQAGIEGRVYLQFIIDKKGNVTNPKVIRGIGGGCDQEALRVVSKAQFTPGLQRGRPVNIQYSMPIVFKLDA